MAYFQIMQGLRGCYMPDSSYVIRADTRRELKSAIQWEGDSIRDAGGIGLNQKHIAWLANRAWQERKNLSAQSIAPYRFGWHGAGNFPFALFVCSATRDEYLQQEESI